MAYVRPFQDQIHEADWPINLSVKGGSQKYILKKMDFFLAYLFCMDLYDSTSFVLRTLVKVELQHTSAGLC